MQDVLCVEGLSRVHGEVRVGGAKNAALPLIFASLLSDQPLTFRNVPDLSDISVTMRLLRSFGAECSYGSGVLKTQTKVIKTAEASYSAVKALRASFWAMGPLLARYKEARVPLPGGDAIGTRPVDMHLQGFTKFGAEIHMQNGVVIAEVPGRLKGAEIVLDFPSVGATHNILMCAALIPERSVIKGAAREPEVRALCELLIQMGAEIDGVGTDVLEITGRSQLGGADFTVLGDRIEAATYLAAAAATQGDVKVTGINPVFLKTELEVLEQMGCRIISSDNEIKLIGPEKVKAVDFETAPHPGIATDVQPMFLAALTKADGKSQIRENIFESRYGHIAEYRRFGAKIEVDGRIANIEGVDSLTGAPVDGKDIRAAAGMVILGMMSEGTTQIRETHHLDRGYDGLVAKMRALGVTLSRFPLVESKELIVGC